MTPKLRLYFFSPCVSRYVIISIILINGMGLSGVTAYVAAFLLGEELYTSKYKPQTKGT